MADYIKSLSDLDAAFKGLLEGYKVPVLPFVTPPAVQATATVPVNFIQPDREIMLEHYPAFVIYQSGIRPDNSRWITGMDRIGTVEVDGSLSDIVEREYPLPFVVYYTVRTYSLHKRQGAYMASYLMTKLRRGAAVTVDGFSYDVFPVRSTNPSATYREFGDQKLNKPDVNYDQFLYRVEIYLTGDAAVSTPAAKEVITRVELK